MFFNNVLFLSQLISYGIKLSLNDILTFNGSQNFSSDGKSFNFFMLYIFNCYFFFKIVSCILNYAIDRYVVSNSTVSFFVSKKIIIF